MIMKREYDFEGTWTTIQRVRDAPAQGGVWARLCVCMQDVGQDTGISEKYGGYARGPSCGLRGSRVSLTVERVVRICMPLHRVPWRLCVCRVLSVIVDCNEESEQDGSLCVCKAVIDSAGRPRASFDAGS